MFYIIGLGLGDCKDITVKGLEIVKKCERVYLESYTSVLTCGTKALEEFYGRTLIVADRDLVEQGADDILNGAEDKDVALLVVGDPFGATTHTDLVIRAEEKGIQVQAVHNASILNAVGCCGLQLYGYGETVSIPYWMDSWRPDSFYDKIVNNFRNNMHTLCLLDIKVKEPTLESMVKKKKVYMPPRFMSVNEAAQQLLEIIKNRRNEQKQTPLGKFHAEMIKCNVKKYQEKKCFNHTYLDISYCIKRLNFSVGTYMLQPFTENADLITWEQLAKKNCKSLGCPKICFPLFSGIDITKDIIEENLCIGLARVGSETQKIVACSLKEMAEVDLGGPLHSLVIAGPVLHPVEEEYLRKFKL